MKMILSLVIIYLIINGFLQLFLVNWILQRNKKITMLLVDYYRKLDMGEESVSNYEPKKQ